MTKKKDPDIVALRMACKAIEKTSERMRKATIEFLLNKYILSPLKNEVSNE